MSKIYFRGGMSPLEQFTPGYVLNNNVLGSNVGNFLYLHGVLRALYTGPESELQANYYCVNHLAPEEVNERFDCFIVPMADGFRNDFQGELKKLTKFIRKLTIPCVVTSVGLRAPYDPDFNGSFPFDEAVKEFVAAVLEKSSCIGVRGEITGRYLNKLGFREDTDYMPVGCSSLYSFGSKLPKAKPLDLNPDSRISFNSNDTANRKTGTYIARTMEQYKNHYFVGQVVNELRHIYVGAPFSSRHKKDYPLGKLSDAIYQEGRARFFINVPSWISFMKEMDFSFGTRLHGNIAATMAGTPSLLVTKDSRTRELADFHHLNCVSTELLRENPSLEELVETQDFGQINRYHQKNFENFVHFLDKNGLDHIYKNGQDPDIAPLDLAIEEAGYYPGIVPLSKCDLTEIERRFDDYYEYLDKKTSGLKKKSVQDQVEIENLKRMLRSAPRAMNTTFVKRIKSRILGRKV